MASSITAAGTATAATVRLCIIPEPKDIGESRQVLRALGRFGQVVMFRSSRYDSGLRDSRMATAMFKDQTAAQRLVAASPLRLCLSRPDLHISPSPSSPSPPSSSSHPTSSSSSSSSSPAHDRNSSRGAEAHSEATHSISIQPSHLNHVAFITRQPFHGGFRPDTRSAIAVDLAHRMPLPGLSDCGWREAPREVHWRIRERWREERMGRWKGRKRLRELWEEGMQAASGSGSTSESTSESIS